MKILKALDLNDVVFIDIETVAAVEKLEQGTALWDSWDYKMKHGRDPLGEADDPSKLFADKAALYPEYGKIVCITIGKIKEGSLRVKSYSGHDEKEILEQFCTALTNITASNGKTVLCGHAIKGFDIPWLMRRCIVNQVPLPLLLDTAHLKPWETTAIDTMDLWKGTGFNGGSLIAIAVALGLHNPKDDIEGFETTGVYYNEKEGLQRIVKYCEKDVLTVANIVLKCRYEPTVEFAAAADNKISTKEVTMLEQIYNKKDITSQEQTAIVNALQTMVDDEEIKIATQILKVALPKEPKTIKAKK